MSGFIQSARSLVTRAVGTRQLQQTLHDGFAALGARLDAIESGTAAWRRSCERRLDDLEGVGAALRAAVAALADDVGGQGQASTERGEAAGNALAEIRAAIAGIRTAKSVGRALDDLRVEVSSLRLDLARELESAGARVAARDVPAG